MMDILLSRLTQQAMQYAIRSGISISTGYALQQCHRLLKEAPKSREREELAYMRLRLENKIRILSPSIDMIELIAARGNTSLESVLSLTRDMRLEIQKLGLRLFETANSELRLRETGRTALSKGATERDLKDIVAQIKVLLGRIEDAVPLLSLAITTSGVNLSTKLSGSISLSRLLQASTFLTSADASFATNPEARTQCGPTYILTMYMLFAGHASRPIDENHVRETTWKEVIHKARVKLWRVPLDQIYTLPGASKATDTHAYMPADAKTCEFAYQLVIAEDLDDNRVHTYEDGEPQPGPFDDMARAGIRDLIPIHEVSKIFYADTGKLLNIGSDAETNNPVVLLKRDIFAEPPRRVLEREQSRQDISSANAGVATSMQAEISAQIDRESIAAIPVTELSAGLGDPSAWRLPSNLDPEWIAFEVFAEDDNSDNNDEDDNDDNLEPREDSSSDRKGFTTSSPSSLGSDMMAALSSLNLRDQGSKMSQHAGDELDCSKLLTSPVKCTSAPIKTSLSLLEMTIKLASLQQFRQESHLAIEDELLYFFLEDSATAGSGSNKDYRQRVRHEAINRVGFDPYDESPIKRRGEEYIRAACDHVSPSSQHEVSSREALAYDDAYGFDESPQRSSPVNAYNLSADARHKQYSSPSPLPYALSGFQMQTPSRSSTPGVTIDSPINIDEAGPQVTGHMTPALPSSSPVPARIRQVIYRARSEPQSSLLSHEIVPSNA